MLRIDREFADQIPPLTEEKFAQLEENILLEGTVLMPLIVWNGVIVAGHNRYKIIQAHPELQYSTYEKSFSDRNAALAWICKNQLGRRNLTPEQKKYLIGERHEAEKMTHGGDRKSEGRPRGRNSLLDSEEPHSNATRKQIAAETHTSDSYVKRAGQYAKGVNAAEEAVPSIKQEILTGRIKPTEAAVSAAAKTPPAVRRELAEQLRRPREKLPAQVPEESPDESDDDTPSCDADIAPVELPSKRVGHGI